MEQYTSEQALNGILNIIQTVVDEHNQRQSEPQKNQTGDLITELLTGVSMLSEKNLSVGSQVEALSKGMKTMKDSGITDNDAKMVASMISVLGDAISELKISDIEQAQVSQLASALITLGSVPEEVIDRINYMSKLDAKAINNVVDILKEFSSLDDFANINSSGMPFAVSSINKILSVLKNDMDEEILASLPDIGKKIRKFIDYFTDINDINSESIVNLVRGIASLKNIKKNDIDVDAIKMLPDIGKDITSFLKKFNKINENNIADNVRNAIDTILVLSMIDKKTIKAIQNLSKLDFDIGNKIASLIKSLDFSSLPEMDQQRMNQNIKQLTTLFNSVNQILMNGEWRFSHIFLPLKGKILGKAMSAYFDEIIKAIDKEQIQIQMSGIAELLNTLLPLVKEDSEYSINRLHRIINAESGKKIGLFFKELIDQIPEKEKVQSSLYGITELLKLIGSFGYAYESKLKILNEDNGKQIGAFLKNIFNAVPDDINPKSLYSISDFLKELASIGIIGTGVLALQSKVINGEFGENINAFIMNLLNGMTDEKLKAVETFNKSIVSLGKSMLMFTGSMLMIAAGIALLGADVVVGSMVLISAFTATTLYIMKRFADESNNLESGTKALINVSKAISLLTLDVIMLGGLTLVMNAVEWESLLKVGMLMTGFGLIISAALQASEKWNKGGESIMEMVKGVSLLMLGSTVAVGLATFIAANNKMTDIALGIGIVGLTMIGAMKIVDMMTERNKEDISQAVDNLMMTVGMFALTALAINFLIVPLADNIGDALIGSALVLGVIGTMIMINKSLASIDEKNLKQSVWNLATMTLMFSTIAGVSAIVLPLIAANIDGVLVGGAVVLAISGLMTATAWMLSRIDSDDLETASNTLLTLTAMFSVVSLVAAFLLPEIGKNFKDVIVGGTVVLGIIAIMVGMVGLVSLIKTEALKQTYITLGVLTVMLSAVSVVSAYLLPEIGAHWQEVAKGGAVVLGIIAVMTGMVVLTNLISKDTLRGTYMTLGVLTVMLATVSFVSKYLLIPIGEQAKEALYGGAIVIGIVGVMVGLTVLLSKVDEKRLMQSYISLAVMTAAIFTVSIITDKYLIPIGYEAEPAMFGGAVVLGIVGIMTAIVALAGQMNKDTILKGTLAVAAVSALIAGVAYVVNELVIPIGENAKQALKGSALITGLVVGFGAIIAAAGQLSVASIAKGTLAVGAVAGLLWGLGKLIPPYIDMALEMQRNAKQIAIGSLEIVAMLTAWGLIAMGAGALIMGPQAAFLAVGEAAIAAIGGLLFAIGKLLPSYTRMALDMATNSANIKKGSKAIYDLLSDFGVFLGKIGLMTLNPISAAALTAGGAVVASIGGIMSSIGKSLQPFVNLVKYMRDNNINQKTLFDFQKVFIGTGARNDQGISMVNAIKGIVKGLSDVGIWSSSKAVIIAKNLKPIFQTLSSFMNVIEKTASMKYVTEWDEYGKAKRYETITPRVLREAGSSISTAFGTFLKELSVGLKSLEGVSSKTMLQVGIVMRPVIDSVATFTKVIIDVISKGIPEEWDENGKPKKFRKINMGDFKHAADVISIGFCTFMESLSENMKNFSSKSASMMNMMKGSIGPLMSAVATYADTIINLITPHEYEYTDAVTGKLVKKHIDFNPDKFKNTSKIVSDCFSGFIETLYNTMKEYDYEAATGKSVSTGILGLKKEKVTEHRNKVTDIIGGLQGISVVLDGVQQLIGIIMKTTQETKGVDLKKEAFTISSVFTSFVNTLSTQLNKTTEQYANVESNLKKIQSMIKLFDGAYSVLISATKKQRDAKIAKEELQAMWKNVGFFISADNLKTVAAYNDVKLDNVVKYMKNMYAISTRLNDITKKMSEGEAIQNACINIMADLTILQPNNVIAQFKFEKIAGVLPYMQRIVDIAKQLKKLQGIMNDSEMTNACLQFVHDIEILTDKDTKERADASRRSLRLFSIDLKRFANVLVTSNKKVKMFSASVHNAKKSIESLDDAIMKKERERNRSLQKFAELIQKMADSVKDLKTQIEGLDENKIVRNFRAIEQVLETVRSVKPETENTVRVSQTQQNSANAQTQKQQANKNANKQGTDTVILPTNLPGKTLVTFNFGNTSFSGFMETKRL